MSVRVFYDILNQKGTPAMYTDTFANRPAYGYQGRLFISTDSGQIFEDTGSAWTLVADAGVGGGTLSSVCLNGNTTATGIVITAGGLSSNSITNTGNTAGSVLFAGASGLESQSNSTFFWDNTNKRLGIGNASPGAPLDIHGTGTQLQLNGTGANNSYIQFQNAGVSKWRIGNTYASASNNFEIYNNSTSTTLLSIIGNNIYFPIGINAVGGISFPSTISGSNYGAIIGSSSFFQISAQNGSTILIKSSDGTNALTINTIGNVNFGSTIGNGTYTYTLPSATGTLALTSNLSSYVPYSGATANVNLGTFDITASQLSVNTPSGGAGINFYIASVQKAFISAGNTFLTFASKNTGGFTFQNPSNVTIFSIDNTGVLGNGTYSYTLPSATGTIALTSNLSSYLPLSGGSLTGNLSTNSYISIENGLGTNQIYLTKSSGDVYGTIQTEAGGNKFSLGNVSNIGTLGTPNITWTSGMQVGINNSSPSYELDVTGGLRSTTASYLATSSGNVGIGLTNPSAKLEIRNGRVLLNNGYGYQFYNTLGTAVNTLQMFTDGNVYLDASDSTGGNLIFRTNSSNTERMRITSGGQVGINTIDGGIQLAVKSTSTTSSSYPLFLFNSAGAGKFYVRSDGETYISSLGTGAVTATGGVVSTTSDMNLKIEDGFIDNALDKVLKLTPRYFLWKEESGLPTDLRQLGFYAQEVNEALGEEVANTPKDKDGKWGIYDRGMIAMLTKAMQEQNQTIQELNEKLVRNNIN